MNGHGTEGREIGGEVESRKLVRERPAKGRKCVFVCVRGGVRGTMAQPGCSDPGKTKLSPGPYSICTI